MVDPTYTTKAAPEVSRRYFYTVPELFTDMESHYEKTKDRFITVTDGPCIGFMSMSDDPDQVHVWWLISIPRARVFVHLEEKLHKTTKNAVVANYLKTEAGRAKVAASIGTGHLPLLDP